MKRKSINLDNLIKDLEKHIKEEYTQKYDAGSNYSLKMYHCGKVDAFLYVLNTIKEELKND